MRAEDEPREQTPDGKESRSYSGVRLDKYKRNSRRTPRQHLLRFYLPVLDAEEEHKSAVWPQRATIGPYTNELLLFRKLWTVENWLQEVNLAENYFDEFCYNNRYQDACFIGTILLYHFILHLRPEDGNAKRKRAMDSFPRNISGKMCYPEGDLLIVPRRKLNRHKGKLASICYALRYLPKIMNAVNKLPGSYITPVDKFGESGPSHLREARPCLELLEKYKLPESAGTDEFPLGGPYLSSMSKFFKPLFTSKYIFLENEKTRYAVETLQLAFVAFQQQADTALWSKEYAYALFMIQNMAIIAKCMDILLPLPILKRYYIFTVTSWYYGRVYFHLSLEQNPEMKLKEKHDTICKNYRSWCSDFYGDLEEEFRTTLNNNFDVDQHELLVFPKSREECLLRSAKGYMLVKIPVAWTRSRVQQNSVILFFCHKELKDWTESLRSQKKTFLFKERKRQLYMILEALCYIKRIQLEYNVRVALCLLEAKCLSFLSILDISQLINWFTSGKSSDISIVDSYSFEKILHFSEWKGAAENCEIDSAELPKIVLQVQQTGIEKGAAPFGSEAAEREARDMQSSRSAVVSSGNLRDGQLPEISESSEKPLSSEAVPSSSNPTTGLEQRHQRFQAYLNSPQYSRNSDSWSEENAEHTGHPLKSPVDNVSASYGLLDDSAASVCSELPAAHSTVIVYRICNIPVAVSNMMKANEYRLEGFEFVDTRKSKYSDFSNELSTTMLSNIMIHYIHLQEYETDRNLLWQMTRDFADVLDKWFQEKKNKKRFNSGILAKVDYPMLNKTFAFMFMGGCLSFYLMYRLEGNRAYYVNARHFYAMMLLQVKKYDLWESVLKSLAEQAEMRKLFLLDCHKDLRRLPDRCVAVIRSYLHMLPLLYEACIMNETVGGPTNCRRLRVRDVFFPFNIDVEPRPDTDTDITLKILRRAKVHLRKAHRFDQQGGIITALECAGSSKQHCKDETLQYCEDITVDFVKTVPKYPVMERWSWKKPEGDTRPLCTGDDDCDSAPCNVEQYIDDEEENNVVTFNLDDQPNFLNELVTLNTRKKDSSNFSSLPNTLLRVRKSLRKVTKKLLNSLDVFPKTGKDGQDQYVTICIPGLRSAEQSQAVPNHKMEDLSLTLFTAVLKRSIGYLCDDGLPEDLALCKALLCLDRLLNLEFRISQLLRGTIADLEHYLSLCKPVEI